MSRSAIASVLCFLILAPNAIASELNKSELEKVAKLLNGKKLVCESADQEASISLSVKKIHKYFVTSMDSEGVGASPAEPDSISMGRRLIVSYGHDEGFGILVVDADEYYWDKKTGCTSGIVTVSWEPSIGDNAIDAPINLTCCKK